ncbi:hypothetical protein [Aurantimonas sp. VKM B-3413]|uniref:hypothetical protein n=1 Tax=Aurantimonas sp. VKM B-3413 TaxID=2779401 RepID=UPI001E2A885D|nr:hypothetical protein [Aurantimonas sp. VKM B-3413]MCB8837451.1 hypothetical protein [Aurantimonas sp. VKM B-3413]
MIDLKRAALAGAAALALLAAPAFAQSGSAAGDQTTEEQGAAEKPAPGTDMPADAAPTPTEPAATETTRQPAAAGGEASDATHSGGPASSASDAEMSGKDGSDQPRNAVGDKFELPKLEGTEQIKMITGICAVQIKDITVPACTCLAEKSMVALSDPQRDYMIASVVAPPVADRMLKDGRVGAEDQKTIFAFIDSTSDACMTETAGMGGTGSGTATPPASDAPAKAPQSSAPETGGDKNEPAK